MLNLLFNAPQNYAWALNYGRRLLEDEIKDLEKNRTEHQINTRIYNNAFCGLLRTGYPFEVITINNQMFLKLVIDNITFQCPSNTVSNILRQEYETLVKPKVDVYVQAESDKALRPENREQITAASEQEIEQETEPVQTPEAKSEEAPTPPAESLPAAEVLQNEKSSTHEKSSPLKTREISDESHTKVTPQKQMEMMRELKKQRTEDMPKEDTGKNKESAAKENSIPQHTTLEAKRDNGDDGEKRKKEQSLHHIMMAAPNLDDIIFAPVAANKKVVEIGEDPAKESSDPEDDEQHKESVTMKTESEAQTPDASVSVMENKKQESDDYQSSKIVIDKKKAKYTPESTDAEDENAQSEPKSVPHLEVEKIVDKTVEETVLDQQEDLKEQKLAHREQVEDTQLQEESKGVQEPMTPATSEQSSKRMFQPKSQRFAPKTVSSAGTSISVNSEGLPGQTNPKEKKGFLSALFGGDKKKDVEVIVPALNPVSAEKEDDHTKETEALASVESDLSAQTDNVSTEVLGSSIQAEKEDRAVSEDIKTESYNHDGGKIFSHIHQVVLKKQFGNSSTGPYRFIFWPLRIIEMQSKKTWADFLVHVTDQNGNETVLCTDGAYKELIIKVDGKEFNVYATWTNGVFDSHVSLYGKTASIYTIEEEIYREESEDAEHDSFLDQFRLERKGQPKHFIVPFKNNNRGELNIPIVGCVELGGKRYPLERREENTLRYRYNGSDKVIRGHWEKGVFQFAVDDVNRFVWEDQNE